MAAQKPTFLQVAPAFGGRGATSGMTAEEFMDRMTSLRTANPNQDAAIFIAEVGGYLEGNARNWFKTLLEEDVGTDEYAKIIKDWEYFQREFKQKYFKVVSAKESSIAWQTMKQAHGEAPDTYTDRLMFAMAEDTKLWNAETKPKVDAEFNGMLPNANDRPALATWLDDNEARRRMLLQTCHIYNKRYMEVFCSSRGINNFLKISAAGFSDGRLRDYAVELGRKDMTMREIDRSISNKARDLAGKRGHMTGAHAVDLAQNATPNQQQQQNAPQPEGGPAVAATAGQKPQGKKKKKQKKKPNSQQQQAAGSAGGAASGGTQSKPRFPCLLCYNPMHATHNCPRLSVAQRAVGVAATAEGKQDTPSPDNLWESGNE